MKFASIILLIAAINLAGNQPQETKTQDQSQAAAGDAQQGQTPPSEVDVCALIPVDQVSGIVGENIGGTKKTKFPKQNPQVTISECTYISSDGMKTLGILIRNSKAGDNAPGTAKQVMVDSGAKVEDVQGLGDVAFWSAVQLQVFKGKETSIVITVMGFSNPKERAIKAAEEVLKKL